MKSLKNAFVFVFVLIMSLGITKEMAKASTISVTHINPLYQDTVGKEDLVQPNPYAVAPMAEEYVSEAEAVVQLREQAVQRVETIVVAFMTTAEENEIITGSSETLEAELGVLMNQLWDEAVAHTGKSVEGDYLKWQYAGWTGGGAYGMDDAGTYYLQFNYTLTYYTTAEQEAAVTEAVAGVLADLALTGSDKTSRERVELIYKYICDEVTYDRVNLEDDTYKLKHTAYAALLNKTAVCQGYALLFYRLSLECGIDARLIAGTGNGGAHGWNIVLLNDVYYNLDSTWDAGKSYEEYDYFLKSENEFSDHIRYDEYNTAEFHASYPMVHDHVAAIDEAVEATCTSTGLTEGSHCSICKIILVEQEEIPVTDHTPQEAVKENEVAAGCTTEGSYDSVVYCETCGGEVSRESQTIPVTGHSEVADEAVEATCTETGLTEGKHCSVCNEILVAQEVVEALGHTEVTDEAVEATCTETGLTEGKHCSVCGEVLVAQEVIPASHTEVIDKAVEATCTETGLTEGKHCSVCNTILEKQEVVNKKEHTKASAVKENETAVSCTTDGFYDSVIYCTECKVEISREKIVIEATGHNEVTDKAIAATETSTGLTEGSHCSKCNTILTAQVIIPKLEKQPVTEAPSTEAPATETPSTEEPVTEVPTKVQIGDMLLIQQASYTVNSDGKTVEYTKAASNATRIVIPESILIDGVNYPVTAVAAKAFANNSILKSVTINGNVTTIGASAFSGCKNLTTVKIGKKVTSIGQKAFYNCKKLKTVSIGSKVQTIGTKAFMNCTSITKVTIPASVKTIGKQAFYNCKKLKTITIKSKKLTTKNVGTKVFGKTYAKAKIKVPKSKWKAYTTLLKKCGVNKKATISK